MTSEFKKSLAEDIPKIAALEKEIFSDAWSVSDLESVISETDGICYSAFCDGDLAAYVLGRKINPEAEIYRVATRATHRNLGLAKGLISHLIEKEKGEITDIFLEVRNSNVNAIKLYTGVGFKEISRRKNYYKNPCEDAINMHLAVGENKDEHTCI